MFAKLVLLFTIIPILELTLLITVGNYIGLPITLGIVVTTALLGATLGKYQGLTAWRKIKAELASGQLPQDALLDGLAVLIASAFLITPGVLTDIAAFTLLFPATRAPIKKLLRKRIDAWLAKEQVGFFGGFGGDLLGESSYYGAEDVTHEEGGVVFDDTHVTIEKRGKKETSQPVVETIEMGSKR